MKSYTFILLLLLSIGLFSCKNEATPKYPKLDLLEYGLPIEINAPEGVEVKMSDLGVMKDVTVKNSEGYYLQIFSSEATQLDATKLIERLKSEVKLETPYFSQIVLEDEDGFIFEKKIDDRINYDFRVVKIQGDVEYIFQTGLAGTYTQEQVKDMFNSVK